MLLLKQEAVVFGDMPADVDDCAGEELGLSCQLRQVTVLLQRWVSAADISQPSLTEAEKELQHRRWPTIEIVRMEGSR